MKKWAALGLVVLGVLLANVANAQCAMCRATLESNVSDGSFMLTSDNLNAGILYLLSMPYVLIAAVAFFWYRYAKKNARKKESRFRHIAG